MNLLKRLQQLWLLPMAGLYCLVASHPALAGQVQPETGYWMPRDVSLDGYRIDWLINITMVFLVILFAIMVIWMGISIFKHTGDHVAEHDHGSARKQVVFALAVSTIIFFIVDGNLWITSIIDLDEVFWNFEGPESDPNVVRIEVNAHQWAWDVRHTGPDKTFNSPDDILELNEIRIPVDTPVIFQLAAVDVIHSLYLPNLRVKQDAVPGYVSPMWFQATQTGFFDIGCAQHCGAHHYKMKGTLIVMSKDEYATWAAEASKRAQLAYNPDDVEAHWGWSWEAI